jgi:undecaprenyl diphosphate synthase
MTDSSSVETSSGSKTLASVPRHVAIIMDGNNRWAKSRGLPGAAGHRAGVETIRTVLRTSRKNGVEILTLFAFSSENWTRPSAEVSALMQLFSLYINSEVKKLHEDNVRLHFIGRRDRLNAGLQKKITEAEQLTAANTSSHLVIAVDYGGQWDIANAARELAQQVAKGELQPEQIDEALFDRHTALADLPKPDLLIRTAGEQRISNFLLWQCAYSEFYFTDVFWPDFGELEMQRALQVFAQRDRRFGGRNEQDAMVSEAAGDA